MAEWTLKTELTFDAAHFIDHPTLPCDKVQAKLPHHIQLNSPSKPHVEAHSSLPTYPIVETFHSVQGEGLWTGTNAFFIRLAGCDVGCPWCDTKISWSQKPHGQIAVKNLVQQVKLAKPFMVVITGGEPLMHDLTPLTQSLKQIGVRLHLETSGSHCLSGQFDWISLSPKRFKPPRPEIYPHADELKVVIAEADDLVWAEAQAAQVPATAVKLLQPEWSSQQSQQLVIDYVKQHSDWRISLQTHKFLGVR